MRSDRQELVAGTYGVLELADQRPLAGPLVYFLGDLVSIHRGRAHHQHDGPGDQVLKLRQVIRRRLLLCQVLLLDGGHVPPQVGHGRVHPGIGAIHSRHLARGLHRLALGEEGEDQLCLAGHLHHGRPDRVEVLQDAGPVVPGHIGPSLLA